jgi:hypothetical protein
MRLFVLVFCGLRFWRCSARTTHGEGIRRDKFLATSVIFLEVNDESVVLHFGMFSENPSQCLLFPENATV